MPETVANYQVPEAHVKMYSANVMAKLVKGGGFVAPMMNHGSYSGEKVQVVNFIGPFRFKERAQPFSDTEYSDVEHTQRWIAGREYDCAVMVDRLDTLKMIWEPTSPYVARMQEAAERQRDMVGVNAIFADAKTGKDGATLTSFKATNVVAAQGTGLSIAKLRDLRVLIKKRHVNLRMGAPKMLVTAEEVNDLIGETQAVSSDYNAVKPLVDGEISRFMGIEFCPYEDSDDPSDGASIPSELSGTTLVRDHPVWVKEGMHMGTWDELDINIDRLPTKNNIWQIHAQMNLGATRIEENQVFKLQTTRTVS